MMKADKSGHGLQKNNWAGLLAVMLFLAMAYATYAITGNAIRTGHVYTPPSLSPASASATTLTSPSIEVCSNAGLDGNLATYQALLISMSNGSSCFRDDINLDNPGQQQDFSNSTARGADWLGILDGGILEDPSDFNLSTWNSSVEAALEQYPDVHEWEIWNEPYYYQSGYQDFNSTHYFNMIRAASKIIKGEYPSDTVVCFGGAQLYGGLSNGVTLEQYDFYKQVWADGASQYCDAISVHAYSSDNQAGPGSTTATDWNQMLSLYENLTGKPVWVTETGMAANDSSLNATQATLVTQTLQFFNSYSYVKRVYWFSLDSYSNYPWGLIALVDKAGTYVPDPKPAWTTFKEFIQGQGSTSSSSTTSSSTTSSTTAKTSTTSASTTTAKTTSTSSVASTTTAKTTSLSTTSTTTTIPANENVPPVLSVSNDVITWAAQAGATGYKGATSNESRSYPNRSTAYVSLGLVTSWSPTPEPGKTLYYGVASEGAAGDEWTANEVVITWPTHNTTTTIASTTTTTVPTTIASTSLKTTSTQASTTSPSTTVKSTSTSSTSSTISTSMTTTTIQPTTTVPWWQFWHWWHW